MDLDRKLEYLGEIDRNREIRRYRDRKRQRRETDRAIQTERQGEIE